MPLPILLRWQKKCSANLVSGVKGRHRLGSRWILFISGPDEDCRVFYFSEEPSECPSGDPEVILSSEGPEDVETSTPCGASLWLE